MKGEDLTVLEQTTQLTHKRFYYVVATPTITLKNITSEVKFAFPEIQQPIDRLSLRFSSGANIFGHVSHSTELVRVCLACQHFDFNSADWISDNLLLISS